VSERAAGTARTPGPAVLDDDLPLLDYVAAGDSQAFEELVQRHKHLAYRVAMVITGNQQDAEEAMQDTFLKVYTHLGEFQRASKFRTWLTRIAINEALLKRRRQRKTESLDELLQTEEGVLPKQLQDWRDDPESIYSKEQMKEIVEKAIHSLPPMYRQAFVMRDVEGLSTEEAAEALQLSIPTLKTRLLRARLMMREALAEHFQQPATLKSRVLQARWRIQDALMTSLRASSGKKEEM